MAYTKQNWECGDLITADKMNHIEDGIEDASSGGTDYYLFDFRVDGETGDTRLAVIPNNDYGEEMLISEVDVDKLPLLYRIFTQEKWIPIAWLNWQIEDISETYASFSDNNGYTLVIDARGE